MKNTNSIFTISIFTILLTISTLHAQSIDFTTTLGKDYYDMGHDAIVDANGNVMVTGALSVEAGVPADAYFSRLNKYGEIEWEQSFGTVFEDGGNEIIEGANNTYFIAGHVDVTGTDECDALCFMINNVGDTLWTRTYGFEKDDAAYACAAAPDGGFVAVGRCEIGDNPNGFILKYAVDGTLEWSKIMDGDGENYISTVKTVEDGFMMGGAITVNGDMNFLLMKTDFFGNIIWQKNYAHAGKDNVYSIQLSDDGLLMVGKSQNTFDGSSAMLMIRTDMDGNSIWEVNYGGQYKDYAAGVDQTPDGNWVVCGTLYNVLNNSQDAAVLMLSDDGVINALHFYGAEGDDAVRRVHRDAAGGYIVCGSINQTDDNADILLMHVDESGATLNIPAANDNGLSVRLYPNPVTETIHIMVSATAIDAQLVVYDISGKKVIHIDNIYSQMIDISATELTSGLYFYSFINKNDATAPLNGTFEVLK